ncbi:hypothetical protein MUK70_15885 [Dyadobacter chenwenxiniae]|uniref:Uncharacterized protein n=1 Tax=Dyadobacter chenwenxiniae TaxID=2906456 RepID=A0A9X1PGE1_9BACT|nr:hypothetical protein [Dyadobacter chenwenxiniae]MCF0060722.1 hypothetical protein [Dyadobacter chenwenxiniae]UON80556.1 hypothetical protein MUK70_15885 [Dyadobacter chenwenxiniae]
MIEREIKKIDTDKVYDGLTLRDQLGLPYQNWFWDKCLFNKDQTIDGGDCSGGEKNYNKPIAGPEERLSDLSSKIASQLKSFI